MKKSAFKQAFVLIMICLLMAGNQIIAQEPSPLKTDVDKRKLIEELEKVIPELMKKADVPGLSIAVIRDAEIIWSRGFGIKNAKTNEPVTEDTIFEAASLTKPFFAYAVMKMVENGELNLDKPLIEYAPKDYIEKEYIMHPMDLEGFRSDWFRKITARMVLSHSSGLPHGEPRKPLPIFFEPGSKYRYSADGYMYLQRIVEYLKGKSLEEVMRNLALEPLGMRDSSMVWQENYETRSAVGHEIFSETDGKFRKRTKAHAAASLYTTARDYARFVIAMMNDTGLKSETIKEMLTPQIDVERDVFWGLGFGLERTQDENAFWQWGDYGIFRNYIVAYKKQKIGLVYLTNSFNGLSIGQDIITHAIGGGKELGLSYLNYDRYDSPAMEIVRAAKDKKADEVVNLFHELRKKHPEGFSESDVNRLGYMLLNAKRVPAAIEILRLNVEAFPESANVYDSLAEAYMTNGDNELAIQYYKKALEAIPKDTKADKEFLERLRQGALDKLKKLEEKKKDCA